MRIRITLLSNVDHGVDYGITLFIISWLWVCYVTRHLFSKRDPFWNRRHTHPGIKTQVAPSLWVTDPEPICFKETDSTRQAGGSYLTEEWMQCVLCMTSNDFLKSRVLMGECHYVFRYVLSFLLYFTSGIRIVAMQSWLEDRRMIKSNYRDFPISLLNYFLTWKNTKKISLM